MTPTAEDKEFSIGGLSDHEKRVLALIYRLDGSIQGFPDTTRKLVNVVRAWAQFMSVEPYQVKFHPQVEPYLSYEDRARYMKKQGVIPGEWLIDQIRKGCEWFPAPVVAREIYCDGGFVPLDGLTMDKMPAMGRKRPYREEE